MPKRSDTKKRSRSKSESSGIYEILRRIECRLDKVEKRCSSPHRRRLKRPRLSQSQSSSESETGRGPIGSRRRQCTRIRSDRSTPSDRESPMSASSRSSQPKISSDEEEGGSIENNARNIPISDLPDDNVIQGTNAPQAQVEGTFEDPKILQDEILSLLGSDKTIRKSLGDPIHADVACRWTHILTSGLEDNIRDELATKYLPPENCSYLIPPYVNPEVKVAISESVSRRDSRLSQLQQQLGASLTAMGRALTDMLKEEGRDNKNYIQLLSDAGRLLSNIFHSESLSRRDLIAINLNKELKDTLAGTPITDFLFGNDLDTRIKTAKDLEKSAEQLKIQKKPSTFFSKTPTRASTSKSNQGNYKSPFSQRYGARKSGQFNRTPQNTSQRKQYHQFPKKKVEYKNNSRYRH